MKNKDINNNNKNNNNIFSKIKIKLLNYLIIDKNEFEKDYFNSECPENEANWLSRLTFSWITRMILIGFFREPLTMKDIPDLPNRLKSENTTNLLKNINFNTSSIKGLSLIIHIYKTFVPRNKLSILLLILCHTFSVLTPLSLKYFLNYISNSGDNNNIGIGILLCFNLFFCSLMTSYINHLANWISMRTALEILGSFSSVIFEKMLKLSNSSKREYGSGIILNLMSNDTEYFSGLFWNQHIEIFLFPLHAIGLLTFLCLLIGPSGLIGLLILALSIPFNGWLNKKLSYNLKKSIEFNDKRINSTNEFISGIKFLKQYAWEKLFLDRIKQERKQQLHYLYKRSMVWIGVQMATQITSALVFISTFTIYTLVLDNKLELDVALTCITIFQSLKRPLNFFSSFTKNTISLLESSKRIESFLKLPEIKLQPFKQQQNEGIKEIIIKNATFDWNESNDKLKQSTYVLNNINLNIPVGKLTIICGEVGSGKSSLLSALIGEIHCLDGKIINMPHSISFASQEPFLISASFRENILFGLPFDYKCYKRIVKACCLAPDLLNLPAYDMTEIGEKGINLSGGQKQRISLARALYVDSLCIIADDIFSSVDNETQNNIFKNCIQNPKIIKERTCIIVTHQLKFLPSADHIIVVETGGKITQGTFNELKDKGFDFKSILNSKTTHDLDDQDQSKIKSSKSINIKSLIIKDINEPDLIEKSKLLVDEDRIEGSVGFDIYKKYFQIGSSLPFIGLTITVYFISHLIFKFSELVLQEWAQSSTTTSKSTNLYYILLYLSFIITYVLIMGFKYYLITNLTNKSSKKLHNSFLKSISNATSEFFDTNPSGRILNRFGKDIYEVDVWILDSISDSLNFGSILLSSLVMMVYATPIIIIPYLILIGLFYVLQLFYRSSSRELKRMDSISRSPVYSLLTESYNGLVTIRSSQKEQKWISMMQNYININLRLFFYNFAVNRFVGIRMEFIGSLIVFITCLFSLFNEGGTFAALAITSSISMTTYLNTFIRQFTELEVQMNSVERILSFSNLKPEGIKYKSPIKDGGNDDNWIINGEIEFLDVQVKYRENSEKTSLNNFSMKVNSNEKIGIVGRTSAGKSTIGLSLLRMLECSKGLITIDGIDISKIGLYNLRSCISIIPQDPYIFNGSLRYNIDPFNKFSDSEIWDALDKVYLKETVEQMNNQLDTIINENGTASLSQGQKQLLCLARVLLRKLKIIFIDEATSSMDFVTSEKIKNTISNYFKNCTILTIAHRLNNIIDSDKIAVVDNGKLVEFDTPSILISNPNSWFNNLLKNQNN